MIKTVMARSMNVMPQDEIDEQIAALGPGWKVVNTSVSQMAWGERTDPANGWKTAYHIYIAVVVVLEKPDDPKPMSVVDL